MRSEDTTQQYAARVYSKFIEPLEGVFGKPRLPDCSPEKIYEALLEDLRSFDANVLEMAVRHIRKNSDYFPSVKQAYNACVEAQYSLRPKVREVTEEERSYIRDKVSSEKAGSIMKDNMEVFVNARENGFLAELYLFVKGNMRMPNENEIEEIRGKKIFHPTDHPYMEQIINFKKAVEKRAMKDAGMM